MKARSKPASPAPRRFVSQADALRKKSAWTLDEWLCCAELVDNRHLLLVRAHMPPYQSHSFHSHPAREELIYILSGRAEQWVGTERRILKPGDLAFIPMGEIHGTYNPFPEKLVFLAILSPADAPEPALVDFSKQEPWASLRKPRAPKRRPSRRTNKPATSP